MTNRISAAVTAIILLMTLAGCTQNNGDISPWFGYWRVESIALDGEPDPAYTGGMTWSFQNNIIDITTPLDNSHTVSKVWGTWRNDADETLTVDFTHWQNQGNEAYAYMAPALLQFSADAPVTYIISSQGGGKTVLDRTLPDGKLQQITLKKAY